MARVTDHAQVEAALEWAEQMDLPVTSIGGGSNLLVDDSGVPGLVLAVRATGKAAEEMVRVEEDPGQVRIWVPAQMPISRLGHLSASHGWSGLVWCAGLPGVVGGAVVNNAGAHGGEMIDHLESEYGYTPQQAYVICSVAVDLKVSELVDVPNFVVSAFLPLDVFVD
jgi:UDP-N-acetylmuramate dehydrogenase